MVRPHQPTIARVFTLLYSTSGVPEFVFPLPWVTTGACQWDKANYQNATLITKPYFSNLNSAKKTSEQTQ